MQKAKGNKRLPRTTPRDPACKVFRHAVRRDEPVGDAGIGVVAAILTAASRTLDVVNAAAYHDPRTSSAATPVDVFRPARNLHECLLEKLAL